MDTALKKARLAARWVKAIFAKGYTQSIDTARYRRANEAVNLRKQAVITKCRGISMRSQAVSLFKIKPRISVPKK